MKIITKKPEVQCPDLSDVGNGQPFVSINDWICIKWHDESYIKLSNEKGEPCVDVWENVDYNIKIKRILPEIIKWEV